MLGLASNYPQHRYGSDSTSIAPRESGNKLFHLVAYSKATQRNRTSQRIAITPKGPDNEY